jgi:transcriptional regulator with XRE-family HTH domain
MATDKNLKELQEEKEQRERKFLSDNLNLRLKEFLGDAKYEKKRREHGVYSYADFAKKIGKTAEAVRQWMAGYSRPSVDTIGKICKIFEIPSDWLLGLSDTMTTDIETREICERIGLSPEAIKNLEHFKSTRTKLYPVDFVNRLIETPQLFLNISAGIDYAAGFELPDVSVPGNSIHADMHYVLPGILYSVQEDFMEFLDVLVEEARESGKYQKYEWVKERDAMSRVPIISNCTKERVTNAQHNPANK